MPNSVPNFNFLALLVSEIKRGPVRWNLMCASSTWQGQTARQISASYLCEYVFPMSFSLLYPKMKFLGVLRLKIRKYCVLTLKKHYPAWIRVCWCIACQNRFNGLAARSVEKFCVQRKKETKNKWMVTLATWGEVTPGAILTICGMWGDTAYYYYYYYFYVLGSKN